MLGVTPAARVGTGVFRVMALWNFSPCSTCGCNPGACTDYSGKHCAQNLSLQFSPSNGLCGNCGKLAIDTCLHPAFTTQNPECVWQTASVTQLYHIEANVCDTPGLTFLGGWFFWRGTCRDGTKRWRLGFAVSPGPSPFTIEGGANWSTFLTSGSSLCFDDSGFGVFANSHEWLAIYEANYDPSNPAVFNWDCGGNCQPLVMNLVLQACLIPSITPICTFPPQVTVSSSCSCANACRGGNPPARVDPAAAVVDGVFMTCGFFEQAPVPQRWVLPKAPCLCSWMNFIPGTQSIMTINVPQPPGVAPGIATMLVTFPFPFPSAFYSCLSFSCDPQASNVFTLQFIQGNTAGCVTAPRLVQTWN